MFENASVFVLAADGIWRLELDRRTQTELCESFAESVSNMTLNKQRVLFDGGYKPENDEYMAIEQFVLPENIKEAVRNPLGIPTFGEGMDGQKEKNQESNAFLEIKAIIIGENINETETEQFNIAFQRFRKEQNLVAMPYRLFWNNNTFRRDKCFGIGVTDIVDCRYVNDELQFISFYYARQIFDLSKYYRMATECEVDLFTKNDKLFFDNPNSFKLNANAYIRRKIAMIKDSSVLKRFSAKQIKRSAELEGISIQTKDNRIVIPEDKNDAKIVLAFLVEEAYRGPFTKKLLLANSKKVIARTK